MNHSEVIRRVLEYIEAHLDQAITVESLSDRFHYSPFYFHRLFSAVAGQTIAAYIRDRRMQKASWLLAETRQTVLVIGLECGYPSAQSFSRVFRSALGVSPSVYRSQGFSSQITPVEALVHRWVNRIKGGMLLHPNIIQRKKLVIAGFRGKGDQTAQVWEAFDEAVIAHGLPQKISDDGYEVRMYGEKECEIFVGFAVEGESVAPPFAQWILPATTYASFDVFVSKGYESENATMDEWLRTNTEGYREKPWAPGMTYVVEHYDERFCGAEAGSIVEIWIPLVKGKK